MTVVELTLKIVGPTDHDLRWWDFSHPWFELWILQKYLDAPCGSVWHRDGNMRAISVSEYVAQQLREKAEEINATLEITLSGMTMRFENEHDYLQAMLSEG